VLFIKSQGFAGNPRRLAASETLKYRTEETLMTYLESAASVSYRACPYGRVKMIVEE
jgi:hypothetical protein